MKDHGAPFILMLALHLMASNAGAGPACAAIHSQNETFSLVRAKFDTSLVTSLTDYQEPKNRHRASYIKMDPRAQDRSQLVSLEVQSTNQTLVPPPKEIAFQDRKFYLYDVGESHLLPLNDLYESEVLKHPAFSKNETLGFAVSGDARIQKQVSYLLNMRLSGLEAVLTQKDDNLRAQVAQKQYANYDFYRKQKWQMNQALRSNGDNDVFVIYDRKVLGSEKTNVHEISQNVLATIQVSYPTGRSFPQDYSFTDQVGVWKLDRLPTVYTWRKGISAENFSILQGIAGDGRVAEIGRYINQDQVPMPVIARMLLQAFEKIEARGVQTVFVFGTDRNILAFTRFYKFKKIDGFYYEVFEPASGLPAERGSGAFHHVNSPEYIQMIEKLKALASVP